MRILFVNKYAEVTGGADRYALELANLLTERGHDVRLIAFRPLHDPPLPGWYIEPTVTGRTRDELGKAATAQAFLSLLWNRAAVGATKAAIREFRPDVAHIHKIFPQLSAGPVVTLARAAVPIIQRAADFEFFAAHPEDFSGSPFDRTSERSGNRLANSLSFALRSRLHVPRVDSWVVATPFMAQTYAGVGIEAEAVPHFLHPAPPGTSPAFEERDGVAFVGRLARTKGLFDMIELARENPDLIVTVAGTGEMLKEAESAAGSLPNMNITGHISGPDVLELMRRSRVVVVPSRWPEPAGLAALEAMNCGTPVVAYEGGGLTDYVRGNGGGVVVPQGDHESLARATLRLHADAGWWSHYSEQGLRGLAANHAPDDHVARIERLYEQAGARAGSANW